MSESEQEPDEFDEIVLAVCRVTKAREKGGEISAEDHAIVQYAESMAHDIKPYARRRPCLGCRRPVADALVLPHLVTCPALEPRRRAERLGLESQAIVEVLRAGFPPPPPAGIDAGLPPRPQFFRPSELDCLPLPGCIEACAYEATATLLALDPVPEFPRPPVSVGFEELEGGASHERFLRAAADLQGAGDILVMIAFANKYAQSLEIDGCPWCDADIEARALEEHLLRCDRHPENERAAQLEEWLLRVRGPAPLPIASLMAELQQHRAALSELVFACDRFSASFGWSGDCAYVRDHDERQFRSDQAAAMRWLRDPVP